MKREKNGWLFGRGARGRKCGGGGGVNARAPKHFCRQQSVRKTERGENAPERV